MKDNPLPCPFCKAKVIITKGAYCVGDCKHIYYWEILHNKGCFLYTDEETKTIIGVSKRSKLAWNTRREYYESKTRI